MCIDSYFQLLYLSFLSCVINDIKELASGKHWSGETKVQKLKYENISMEVRKKSHLLVSRALLIQHWGVAAKEC